MSQDQAARLRELALRVRSQALKVIIVTGPHGKVGKTLVATNVARALKTMGNPVTFIGVNASPPDGPGFRGPQGELTVTEGALVGLGASGYVILDAGSLPLDFGMGRIEVETAFLVVSPKATREALDSYALCKLILQGRRRARVGLVVNREASPKEALRFVSRINGVLARFIGQRVDFIGCVPEYQDMAALVASDFLRIARRLSESFRGSL